MSTAHEPVIRAHYRCTFDGRSDCFVALTTKQALGHDEDALVEVTIDSPTGTAGVRVVSAHVREITDLIPE